MPQKSKLDELYGDLQAPSKPLSLDDVYGDLTPPETPQTEGYLDRIKKASGKDWLATGIRVGGGFLAGIPSMVPGLGTALGAGIGGGSELIAQLIQGEPIDYAGIGVAGAAGAIPMGKLLSVAAPALKGATALERMALLGKATGANLAKGAATNVGLDVAYRTGHGQVPGQDYGWRDELFPALVGGVGQAGAGMIASRAARAAGARDISAQAPVTQAGLDFDGPLSAAERRAAYRIMRGYDEAPVASHTPAAPPPPEPLTPGAPVFRQVPGTKRYAPIGSPDAPVASHGPAKLGGGRNINQPLREPISLDEIYNGVIAPEPMVSSTPTRGRMPWEPKQAALGVDRMPLPEEGSALRDLKMMLTPEGAPMWPGETGAPRWPSAGTIQAGREAMAEGRGIPRELMEFFGVTPEGRQPIGRGFSDTGQMALEPNQPGTLLPTEPRPPRPFGWQGPSRISAATPDSPRTGWVGPAFAEPAPRPVPTAEPVGTRVPPMVEPPARTPISGPEWPGNIPQAQRALGFGEREPANMAAIRRFFGLDSGELPPGVAPESGPIPPGFPPESAPMPAAGGTLAGPPPSTPAVPSMTVDRLRELLGGGIRNQPELAAMRRLSGERIPADLRQELANIADELDMQPFIAGETIDTQGRAWRDILDGQTPAGMRDSSIGGVAFEPNPDFPNLIRHSPGAPVYHEIGGSQSRGKTLEGIQRILSGAGRGGDMTDRAVEVAAKRLLSKGPGRLEDVTGASLLPERAPNAGDILATGEVQPRLPGEVGAVRDLEVPNPQFERRLAAPDDFELTGQGGAGQTGTLDFAAEASAAPPKAPDSRIKELYDWLQGELDKTEAKLAAEGNPLAGGPRESLADFEQRLRTADPRDLWNKERKLRKILDEGGFITPEMLMQLGGAATGAAVGPWVDEDNPLRGAALGALAGFAAGKGGARLLNSPGTVRVDPGELQPVSRRYAKPGERPPVGTLKLTSRAPEPEIQWLDSGNSRLNASGESSASLEALSRQSGMKARGEQFVVYDRTGQRRPLIGPDAVDYRVRPGETYGVETPSGFRKLDDMGGRYPGRYASDAGFVDMAAMKGAAPLIGAGVGAVAGPALDDDPYVGVVGGAGAGALAGLAISNPRLLERIRYSSLLSGAAMPKSMLGDVGALVSYSLEHPGAGKRILGALADTGSVKSAMKRGWESGLVRENLSPEGAPLLSFPGRVMGAFDEGTRDALVRAGATPEDAARYVLMGEPASKAKKVVDLVKESPQARAFLPFARTSVNAIERGMERTPGLGSLPSIQAWESQQGRLPLMGQDSISASQLSRRRQVLGALAMLGGMGIGELSSEGGPLEDYAAATPFLSAALGPYMLPVALGNLGMQGWNRTGDLRGALSDAATGIERELPLPRTYTIGPSQFMRQLMPYGGGLAALSPIPASEFDTKDSLFAPALARLPFINELLLDRKRTTGR